HKYESGRLQWRDNKVREANYELTTAAEILGDDADVWFLLAEAQRALNDRSAAKRSYEECLRLAPNHGRAIVGLGLVQ
ncbi:tetratricopeptide repeat protein, partial [Pirellulaceae bacterium]|nr:tetratricopeptide repeat protein [Pirellulaceae bacterium]